jgi:hypothetical protein
MSAMRQQMVSVVGETAESLPTMQERILARAKEDEVEIYWTNTTSIAVGASFGRLTTYCWFRRIFGPYSRGYIARYIYWYCVCECGNITAPTQSNLLKGVSGSCGCRVVEMGHSRLGIPRTHGAYLYGRPTAEYRAWNCMKVRCLSKFGKERDRRNYQERGIMICEEWQKSFQAFFDHIGPKPGPGYLLDRIDNDGNYEPGNVKWSTSKESAQNRRKPTRRK